MCSCRIIVFLATIASVIAVDSEGTNFVFGFVRNANPDITNQVLSATVINQNSVACSFSLTYRPNYDKRTPSQVSTTNLPVNSSTTVPIPSWYGFNYTGYGVQDDLYLSLQATSTCNVTVLANNYDNITQQGDTYLVLPTNWGSTSFTFSLPPAVISTKVHYEQVLIFPTTSGYTNVAITEIGVSLQTLIMNITNGNSPAAYIGTKTPDTRPRTYHVVSDKPVLIVAGVTCAGQVDDNCDHAAYMPHPQAAVDCYDYDYYDDDHISYLPTTTTFFTDIPGSCSVGQNISYTLNDGVTYGITIKPAMESPLWSVRTTTDSQKGVAFHNGGSNIHIARYYDGSKYTSSSGTLLSTSPSITQFHTSSTAFHTRNANDTVEIYCTVLACTFLQLDGVIIYDHDSNPTLQIVDNSRYLLFYITVPQAGYHQLFIEPTRQGTYGFFVFGKNGQYSYGYEGGVNKPTVVLAPNVSTTSTTRGSVTTQPTSAPSTSTPSTSAPSTSVPSTSEPPASSAAPVTTPAPAQTTVPITTGSPITAAASTTSGSLTTAVPQTTSSSSAAPVTTPVVVTSTNVPVTSAVPVTTAVPITGASSTTAVPSTGAPNTTPAQTTTTTTGAPATTQSTSTAAPSTVTTTTPTTPTTTTSTTTTTASTTTIYSTTQSSTQQTLYLSFILSIIVIFYF